jgi:hypothetical protein
VPATPAVLPAAKKEPPPKTEALPPPPTITPDTPAADTESVIPTPPPAPPPVPAKTPRRPQRPAAPVQQPAAPAAPATASPQAPTTAPQLAIVLTPEQQRQYNSDIDQSIQRAEGNLRSIGNRQLTSEQQASSDEARNFIRQAQAARASDLPAAKRLAERADVLAANLANSLR